MTPQEETPASSSMEEAPRSGGGGARASVEGKSQGANPQQARATPAQSALRADISSIEEERGAWLKSRAKAMRREMTPHEKAVWRLLHQGELVALNWRRQAVFGDFVLDFVSHPARLVVEVDGAQHGAPAQAEYDAKRTAWLATQGYRVVRIWNNEALSVQDDVWRTINAAASNTPARARMERWRDNHMAEAHQKNAQIASSSTEEAPRSGGGGARAARADEPQAANPRLSRASPPQSALRADSSSIEEER